MRWPLTSNSYSMSPASPPLARRYSLSVSVADRSVARVAPLRAATIFDEPIRNRLDQFVARLDGEQRPQSEGRRLDASVRPPPVNSIFAPMRRADRFRLSPRRRRLYDRSVGRYVHLHSVLKIADERRRPVAVAEIMGAQRQQRASVGVELFAVLPQVVEGFGLNGRLRGASTRRDRPPARAASMTAGHSWILLRRFPCRERRRRAPARPFLFGLRRRARASTPRLRKPSCEVIAIAFLPPAPSAVGMLKVIQAVEPLPDHLVELA